MPPRACAWIAARAGGARAIGRGPLLDVGTGSGVLAIAAARLGFAPVLGLDHERESVAATEENARVNGVAIEVRRFDLRTQALPWLDARGLGLGPDAVGMARWAGGVVARDRREPAAPAAARPGARHVTRAGASAGGGPAEGAGRRGGGGVRREPRDARARATRAGGVGRRRGSGARASQGRSGSSVAARTIAR